jgi:uncharacterized protein (DUF2384 family)
MSRLFRRKDVVRLSPEEAVRQGRAARLAWETFPEPGAAVAFLNTFHLELGGRPIDLAVASAQGLLAVEQEIAARAG